MRCGAQLKTNKQKIILGASRFNRRKKKCLFFIPALISHQRKLLLKIRLFFPLQGVEVKDSHNQIKKNITSVCITVYKLFQNEWWPFHVAWFSFIRLPRRGVTKSPFVMFVAGFECLVVKMADDLVLRSPIIRPLNRIQCLPHRVIFPLTSMV